MMNPPARTPLPSSADDAAAYWMMRRLSGSMTSEEKREFDAWLAAAEENARAMKALGDAVDEADAHDEALLSAEFERQLNDAAALKERAPAKSARLIAASLATAAIAVVISLFAYDALLAPDAVLLAAHETKTGEMRTIDLDDGSKAQLNTSSRMTVAYSKDARAIELQDGEAFFTVEKDKARPFVVKTAQADIVVTGTSFDVFSDRKRTTVHVLTGVVDVAPRFGPIATLLAGDMIEIDANGKASAVTRYDPGVILAWRNGKARFREEPLGEVVDTLNRYFETPIALGDDALADLPVTGEFDIRDRETAIRALSLIFDLEPREEPARTILAAPEKR